MKFLKRKSKQIQQNGIGSMEFYIPGLDASDNNTVTAIMLTSAADKVIIKPIDSENLPHSCKDSITFNSSQASIDGTSSGKITTIDAFRKAIGENPECTIYSTAFVDKFIKRDDIACESFSVTCQSKHQEKTHTILLQRKDNDMEKIRNGQITNWSFHIPGLEASGNTKVAEIRATGPKHDVTIKPKHGLFNYDGNDYISIRASDAIAAKANGRTISTVDQLFNELDGYENYPQITILSPDQNGQLRERDDLTCDGIGYDCMSRLAHKTETGERFVECEGGLESQDYMADMEFERD